MIQLRKNPLSETQIEIPFIEGETAKELLDRAISNNGYELSDRIISHFQIVINGHALDKDLFGFCKIKPEDTVLIAPIISRGDGGQMFKMVAIIAITVAATYFLGPAGAGFGAGGVAIGTAVATIAGTLALNALIPPPSLPGIGGLGGVGASFEGSQMYTITSQSNNAKKFGSVPKVYGSHRMFPLVAANPYTEIEADPGHSGSLVQFFYCIYDFGFGPLDISAIKIGDTLISDYADSEYRLVDLNKPAVDEGEWDEKLNSDFTLYKGDVERDGTSVVLNKNLGDSGVVISDYQVVRSASDEVNGNSQEISLDFVCPEGLIAYAINGNTSSRTIDLLIEFSKVGMNDWKPYNELDFVDGFTVVGGSTVFSDKYATLPPITQQGVGNGYTLLSTTQEVLWRWIDDPGGYSSTFTYLGEYLDHDNNPLTPSIRLAKALIKSHGYAKGATQVLLNDGAAINRDVLYYNGTKIGIISSVVASIYPGYSWYNLQEPTATSITLFTIRERYYQEKIITPTFGDPIITYGPITFYDGVYQNSPSLTNKILVKAMSLGVARISAKNTQTVYATFKFKPKEISQFDIRVTRTASSSSATYRVQDKLTLASVSTRFNRNPILTTQRHVFLEVKVKATNQLNGSITNLSAITESILDVYDENTLTWSKQKTNNPAWVFCDLLTGAVNKRAISKTRLHLPTIVEWAEFCDEVPTPPASQTFTLPRFSSNFVLDFDTTLQSLLNTMTNSAQASLNVVDGKYGVLIDKLRTIPVQIFTPRNSSGFTSTRSYSDSPHALKIKYVDPSKNWDIAEVIVYDNDYDAETATEFDELSTFACTNYEQAWRFGRYMLAQSRLRKERISITVDFEYLVCTRGDYVQITQDVMRAGGRPARVKTVVGTIVTIDDGIDTLPMVNYGYVYRNPIDGIKTSTLTVINSSEFDLDGDLPTVGDIIIVGEVGNIVFDCIVKTISPSSDLTATLELIEKADAIHSAESSDVLPSYNPQLNLNADSSLATPGEVENLAVISNSWRVVGGKYEYYIGLDWDAPTGSAYETFEIYVNNGTGYALVDFTKKSDYEFIVDTAYLDISHGFKVIAVSSTGKKLNLIDVDEVTATPLSKTAYPSNVLSLSMNITNQVIQLDWPPITDADLKEYQIRYSPKTVGAVWENSIGLLKIDKQGTSASTQGRTGTYLIKALDLNGNESAVEALALTTIPNLFDLNVIEETNDFPILDGVFDATEDDSGALTLQRIVVGGVETNQYAAEGYYYYSSFLDLAEIFTVRLQSRVEAEGFTVGDLMSEWVTLDSVLYMSNSDNSEWNVETQYRTTDTFNTMSDWLTLDSIDPLSEGSQDNWTTWKTFVMGDATGRIFGFRLKLTSINPSVTPRVFEGLIRADMPDRVESYNNLVSTVLGLEVAHDPAFKGPGTTPNIQITQDAASQGDYYVIENKTLAGFKITFYDKNDTAVIRQFDVAVKGYGRQALAVI